MLESNSVSVCCEKISFLQLKSREKFYFYDLSSSTPRNTYLVAILGFKSAQQQQQQQQLLVSLSKTFVSNRRSSSRVVLLLTIAGFNVAFGLMNAAYSLPH